MISTVLMLLGLLLGYFWGRKGGYHEGLREGLDVAALELKKWASESGNCPVCGKTEPLEICSGQI